MIKTTCNAIREKVLDLAIVVDQWLMNNVMVNWPVVSDGGKDAVGRGVESCGRSTECDRT